MPVRPLLGFWAHGVSECHELPRRLPVQLSVGVPCRKRNYHLWNVCSGVHAHTYTCVSWVIRGKHVRNVMFGRLGTKRDSQSVAAAAAVAFNRITVFITNPRGQVHVRLRTGDAECACHMEHGTRACLSMVTREKGHVTLVNYAFCQECHIHPGRILLPEL